MLLSRAWTASPICSKEATYPGHMLIRFSCDSAVTFLRGLHKKNGDSTVPYFSIINVINVVPINFDQPIKQIKSDYCHA